MSLPPYGWMHVGHLDELDNPISPQSWKSSEKHYLDWVNDVGLTLADRLWPLWDEAEQSWRGKAEQGMQELTAYDLSIMPSLMSQMSIKVSSRPQAPSHEVMFYVEDGRDGGRPGMGLRHYHAPLDPQSTQRNPVEMFYTGLVELVGSTTLLLKHALQRPRPFQVKSLDGGPRFSRYHADTADTPSMISGHCYEGSLAGAWVAMRHFQWANLDWAEAEPALEKWVADVGDRRVFAQVHYPSDNLSSWWVALDYLDTVSKQGGPEAAWLISFVKGAIRRSVVYETLYASEPPCELWPGLRQEIGEPIR